MHLCVCRYISLEMLFIYIVAIKRLYDVTWKRINNTLEFTCEIACRTPLISGCAVILSNGLKGGQSLNMTGMIEAIAPHYVTVVINNVDPLLSYTFSASVVVIMNTTLIYSTLVRGIVPACKLYHSYAVLYTLLHLNTYSLSCSLCTVYHHV